MTGWVATARGLVPVRRSVRIGVTGLARAGKTALLTSIAANLLAAGAGIPVLPALTARLAGRSLRVSVAPAGAADLPRFDTAAHLAALAHDPPSWPSRTGSVSALGLDLLIGQPGMLAALPPQRVRLELLDYPGEWLLDLPMLGLGFGAWSAVALRRVENRREAADFLAFLRALPEVAPGDESLARDRPSPLPRAAAAVARRVRPVAAAARPFPDARARARAALDGILSGRRRGAAHRACCGSATTPMCWRCVTS